MRRRGLTPGGRLLLAETVPAGNTVAFALGLSPAEPVVHLARVRTADAVPMCVENVYLAGHPVPGLLDAYTENGSLYELLETRYRIRLEDADQSVRATVLDTANAQLLNVPPFTAALQVERTGYDQRGRAVEHATSLYRGDRYLYQISLHRNSADGPAH